MLREGRIGIKFTDDEGNSATELVVKCPAFDDIEVSVNSHCKNCSCAPDNPIIGGRYVDCSFLEDIEKIQMKYGVSDIVKKQRGKDIGKLNLQKSVEEEEFQVSHLDKGDEEGAATLHKDLAEEHFRKQKEFLGVIQRFVKQLDKLFEKDDWTDKDEEKFRELLEYITVNSVEYRRHYEHGQSHLSALEMHKALGELYKDGEIPTIEQINEILNKDFFKDTEKEQFDIEKIIEDARKCITKK